jgi:hypothetical protein
VAPLKLTVQLPEDLVAVLDARRGSAPRATLAGALLIDALSASPNGRRPKQMTRADVRRKLEVRARGGSAPALRQVLALLEEDRVEAELAAWRSAELAYERGLLSEDELEALGAAGPST